MATRLLREGILTSERVNRLSLGAEVFYRRVMSVVDDYGRYFAKGALLRAALYPLRIDTVTDEQVAAWVAECEQVGLLRVYQVKGQEYLELWNFLQQVRAKKSKFPEPESEKSSAEQPLSTCKQMLSDAKQMLNGPNNECKQMQTSVHLDGFGFGDEYVNNPHSPQGGGVPSSDEAGVAESSDAPESPESDDLELGGEAGVESAEKTPAGGQGVAWPGFQEFWSAWPRSKRKAAREQCLKVWRRKKLEPRAAELVRCVEAWKRSRDWTKEGGEYVPAPLPWLRQERYEAALPGAASGGGGGRYVDPLEKAQAEMAAQGDSPWLAGGVG